MKFWIQFWTRHHAKHMTEVGKEIVELIQTPDSRWGLSEHRLQHRQSGLTLWHSTQYNRTHIENLSNTNLSEHDLSRILNKSDRYVIWHLIQILKRQAEKKPAETALNALRLARMKENPQ